MSAMHLLEGDVADDRDARIADLEAELRATKQDLRQAQAFARDAEAHAAQLFAPLRRSLTPLYRSLQQVFGELDGAHVPEEGSPTAPSAGGRATDPRWESWKQKLPGRPAEMIDLLLLHGEMNRNQLMAAMRAGKDVVRVTVSKLHVAGLVTKNGGRVSLKALVGHDGA